MLGSIMQGDSCSQNSQNLYTVKGDSLNLSSIGQYQLDGTGQGLFSNGSVHVANLQLFDPQHSLYKQPIVVGTSNTAQQLQGNVGVRNSNHQIGIQGGVVLKNTIQNQQIAQMQGMQSMSQQMCPSLGQPLMQRIEQKQQCQQLIQQPMQQSGLGQVTINGIGSPIPPIPTTKSPSDSDSSSIVTNSPPSSKPVGNAHQGTSFSSSSPYCHKGIHQQARKPQISPQSSAEIYKLHSGGKMAIPDLCKMFNLSRSQVYKIIKQKGQKRQGGRKSKIDKEELKRLIEFMKNAYNEGTIGDRGQNIMTGKFSAPIKTQDNSLISSSVNSSQQSPVGSVSPALVSTYHNFFCNCPCHKTQEFVTYETELNDLAKNKTNLILEVKNAQEKLKLVEQQMQTFEKYQPPLKKIESVSATLSLNQDDSEKMKISEKNISMVNDISTAINHLEVIYNQQPNIIPCCLSNINNKAPERTAQQQSAALINLQRENDNLQKKLIDSKNTIDSLMDRINELTKWIENHFAREAKVYCPGCISNHQCNQCTSSPLQHGDYHMVGYMQSTGCDTINLPETNINSNMSSLSSGMSATSSPKTNSQILATVIGKENIRSGKKTTLAAIQRSYMETYPDSVVGSLNLSTIHRIFEREYARSITEGDIENREQQQQIDK